MWVPLNSIRCYFVYSNHDNNLVSNHFWMDANCRSGSVCLDVINQTWSPMFGNNWSFRFITCVDIQLVNIPCCVIITTGTPGALYFKSISDILQILSMCLRSSSHNFYYIRILLIHWMEMLLHWWCVIGLLMNKKWKVTRLSIHSVRLVCLPASQQCFSLTPNQHQPPANSQPAVLFSNNKSAPATSHSQPATNIHSVYWYLYCNLLVDYIKIFNNGSESWDAVVLDFLCNLQQ